jgi:hypothetical protein
MSLPNVFNIKNSPQQTDDLKKINIHPHIRLSSFDISNMYANTPITYLRCIIENILYYNSIEIKQKQEFSKYGIL